MKEEEFFLVTLDQEKDEEETGYHRDFLMWLSECSTYYEVYDVGFYDVIFKKRGSYENFRGNLLQAVIEYGFEPSRVFTSHLEGGSASLCANQNSKTKLSLQ